MKKYSFFLLMSLGILLTTACEDDDLPPEENEEEVVTDVILTFTPEGGGTAVEATAQDPDGEGVQPLAVVNDIVLAPNTTYTLTMELENSIADESITEEIDEEDEEHMFFFGWTDGLFTDPSGDGNIGDGNRSEPVNYNDFDDNNLPLGLSTDWTTGDAATGTFRVILKHQPDIKTATSDSQDGESDVDLTWDLIIE
ncbi:MAG: hypothetical protein ACLFUB_16650 [Cyclobacteriaceae bacterium]